MKLKLLQENRGSLVKQARAILDAAATENRGLTADELAKYSGLEGEIDGLTATIDAEMRQIARESQKPLELTRGEERDVDRFNFAKVLRHLDKVFKGQPTTVDGIEAEMLQQGETEMRAAGVDAGGICLPTLLIRERRSTLSVTGGTNDQYGGTLVPTEKRGLFGDFYNTGVLESSGAMVLQGLTGNIDLPVYTKGTDPAKKTENETSGDVGGTFASLALSPERLAGYIPISDRLLLQSPQALETFVGSEIRKAMIGVRETAFFHGTGTSEPTGIAATSGIGSVVGGTNGAAPDESDIIDLETEVAIDNALEGNVRYFTNAKVRGKLKKTAAVASTDSVRVWDRKTPEAPLNGYPASVTNSIKSNLTKGSSSVASAIFFGNAADFVIGYWGGVNLEIVRDVADAKAGQRHLVANQYYDAGLLRARSFSAMLDALTV
jgi:HK97 family phage major capsid protein